VRAFLFWGQYTYLDLFRRNQVFEWHGGLASISIELRQIKDGREGEDSFPSWGLKVTGEVDQGTKGFNLISRQPHGRSVWLGRVLADQLKVPFMQSLKGCERLGVTSKEGTRGYGYQEAGLRSCLLP
jgi:hypothetical protein